MPKITYTERLANRIQNWGEQDTRINNAEMKRWRKKWASEPYTPQSFKQASNRLIEDKLPSSEVIPF